MKRGTLIRKERIGEPYARRGKTMALFRLFYERTVPITSRDSGTVIGWTTFHDWNVKDCEV